VESQTQSLSVSRVAVERCLMRKGSRVFALLGKATPSGIASFGPDDVSRGWAVTSERGSLRLERLSGDEELTGLELSLPTPACYDYGIAGVDASPAVTRAVFGLLPAELEQIVAVLRRDSFPVLGFSSRPLKCSISGGIIPGCWPHVVLSNQALYGNVICLESFVRIVVSSLPQGQLAARFPALQPMLKQLMMLVVAQRRGLPYHEGILSLAPA
jgi:hypothetical protein